MRIQHNVMAMSAYRNYTNNVSAMKKNLEKLSSGYKINRAGDDAAGLAISEKMRAQITGLETAQKNAKDGISLVQTDEGALTEVHDMLNRMVELATMSANGTYDNDTDRFQLQKEMDQLMAEIDRIATGSNFNGIKLLDGEMDAGGVLEKLNLSGLLPAESSSQYGTIGTETVLKKGGEPAKASVFGVQFGSLNITAETGDTLTVKVGDEEFTLELDEGENTAESLAEKLKDYIKNDADGKFGDVDVTVELGGDGTSVIITQTNPPADGTELINAEMEVQLTYTTGGVDTVLGNGSAGGDDDEGFEVTEDTSGTYYDYKIDFTGIKDKVTGDGTLTFTIAGQTITIEVKEGDDDKAIVAALKDALDGGGQELPVDGTTGKWIITIENNTTLKLESTSSVASKPDGPAMADALKKNVTVTFTADDDSAGSDASSNVSGSYNAGTINIVQGNVLSSDQRASTRVDLNDIFTKGLTDGSTLTIGGTTYTFTLGDKSKVGVAGSAEEGWTITLDKALSNDALIRQAVDLMSHTTTDAFSVGSDSPTSITLDELKNNDKYADELTTKAGFESLFSATTTTPIDETKGLLLQIGDTADSYNQLRVSIKDCHVKAMDLSGIKISDQTSAAAAVDAIKNAINYVSDVRGTLGATQNRLDHTINNLSVMTENIQDAESTIRDVDIAEEMMAYTKNNILIQASQAMLAQANQVPQGVLQLLQ